MKNLLLAVFCLLLSLNIYAQCPAGQTEISLEIFHISFGNEVGWELVDQTTGTVIACRPAGTYATSPTPTMEGPFCVTDGNTIVLTGYDSFGDDWNGGFFNLIVTEDGSVNGCASQDACVVLENAGQGVDVEPDVSVTNSCETSNEEFVIVFPVFGCDATPISGCTDVAAPNFNSCATIDDGSCIIPPINDMCANAIAIPVNPNTACGIVTNATIESATDSGLDVPPEDNTICTGTEDDDIWFSFIATSTDHQIDLINITGSTTDLYHSVWEGTCGALTNINCSDPNTSMLTGLTPGNTYIVRVYTWTATSGQNSVFDICIGTPCSSPEITATAVCAIGDDSNFYVEVNTSNFGSGNTAYTVDIGGPQANISAAGLITYGPFPSGTPVDIVITGVDDASCGLTFTGLDKVCVCEPLSVEAVADSTLCPGEPFTLEATLNETIQGGFIDYTVTTAAAGSCTTTPDNPADCTDLGLGDDTGSGPISLGFNFEFFGTSYSSVCLSSNGYVTFTCIDETDLSEDAIPSPTDPNAIIALFWDDLNPTDAISGIVCTYPSTIGGQTCFVVDYQGVAHFGGGETITGQIILCPDNTVTINCIDCQSDGGTDSAVQGIEDETGTTGAFDPAFPNGTVPGAASTSNCVTFTPNITDPGACNFVAWVTDLNDIAGSTVSTSNPFEVNPVTTTTYYAVVDCGNGVLCADEVVVTVDDAVCCEPNAPVILQSLETIIRN